VSAHDNMNPQQFMYHVSPHATRKSITAEGLVADYAEGPSAVYLSAQPSSKSGRRGYDTYKVDTSGLDILTDPHETCHDPKCEFRHTNSYYSPDDIPPERLQRI